MKFRKSKSYDKILNHYKSQHHKPLTKWIHRITVPLIFISLLGLLNIIPTPDMFSRFNFLSWATVAALFHIVYHAFYGTRIFFMGLLWFSFFGFWILVIDKFFPDSRGIIFGSSFVVSLAIQLYSHKLASNKPAFTEDIRAILLGVVLTFDNWH